MARIDSLSNFLTDVAGAIRQKREVTAMIEPKNFGEEIASIEAGGLEINHSTIRQYIANETVKAGDFVKLSGTEVQKVSNSSDTILGIAKTKGNAGSTVKIIVSNL